MKKIRNPSNFLTTSFRYVGYTYFDNVIINGVINEFNRSWRLIKIKTEGPKQKNEEE